MSEFNAFCKTPKAVIQKVAATVPLYEFTGPVGGNLVGADLDGNGKVDLISSGSIDVSRRYENIKNHGDLKNGLWKSTGTITRQELIALREDCGDGDKHQIAWGIMWGGAGVGTLGATVGIMCIFAGAPVAVVSAAVAVGVAGLAIAVVPAVRLGSIDTGIEEKLDSLMWRKTKVGALL